MSDQSSDRLRISLAQLNPVVGALQDNAALARKTYDAACSAGSDLILFSELFITGYPPEDLILRPAFQRAAMDELRQLAPLTAKHRCAMLIGTPWLDEGRLYNALALLAGGEVRQLVYKRDLPNYGVFDEKRVFTPGPPPDTVSINGVKLAAPICEDIWSDGEICRHLADQGAEILLVANGSPFTQHKRSKRDEVVDARIKETGLPLVYVNQVGGQDELVFDGASFVRSTDLETVVQLPSFRSSLVHTDWRRDETGWNCREGEPSPPPAPLETIYGALVLGLRDYVEKNRFPGVVLGLSGGIDSALCAAIAVDALGADRVHCLMLPYQYTSAESLSDAAACAGALGVRYDVVPIKPPVEGFLEVLSPLFKDRQPDVTEENLQSRTRGVLLMAVSNKFNSMLVTTGNKSEMSVGYATIYGDMNGGFNPIKDIYKTRVYELSCWRNRHQPDNGLGPAGEVIPANIIAKAPSAELRADQTDQDSLPPYDVLDDILECLVEREMSVGEIVARGHDKEVVKRIEHLLHIAEYKRRQAPPGIKITTRNFGRDRRYPITNRFRDRS